MVSQYPHIFRYVSDTGSPVLTDGEWVFGSDAEPIELKCRAESNGQGKSINTGSGTAVIYDYTIYLPKQTIEIPFGTRCTVVISPTKSVELTVLRHENGQLNTRIWL